jgi:alpha-tubulin suppressor-like RCC1 family protein
VQVGALTTWFRVATSSALTVATKTDGTLWTWGTNAYGQLGDNTTVNKSSPVQIGASTNWARIAAGNHQIIATTAG